MKRKSSKPSKKRYSISVSGSTYARLRGTVKSESLQKFVDAILASALDDPAVMERLAATCRSEPVETK